MTREINVVAINDSWMNVSDRKKLYIELLETWMDFFLFFTPAAIIVSAFSKNAYYFGFFLIIAFFIQTLLKRYCKNLIVFLLINAAYIALYILLYTKPYEQIAFGAVLIIRFIICLKQRYNENVEFRKFSYISFSAGEFIVAIFVIFGLEIYGLKTYITVAALNNMICALIYINVTRTDNLMKWEGTYLDRFQKKINMSKLFIVFIVLLVMVGTNILFWKTGMYSAMDNIQNRIMDSFKVKHHKASEKPQKQKAVTQQKNPQTNNMFKLDKNVKPNPIVEFIVKLVGILIYIAIGILMIYLLGMIILKLRELYRIFGLKTSNSEEQKESLINSKDVTEAINSRIFKFRDNMRNMMNVSNSKKIRKAYYKLVQKKIRSGLKLKNSSTPFEIEQIIELNNGKQYEDMTKIYEKARYSCEECTDEEVQAVKKLTK